MFGQVTVFILEHLKENASWRDFIFKANKINFDSFCIYFIDFIYSFFFFPLSYLKTVSVGAAGI